MDQFDQFLKDNAPRTKQRPDLAEKVTVSIARTRIVRRIRWVLLSLAVTTSVLAVASMVKHGLLDVLQVTISTPSIITRESGLYLAALRDAFPLVAALALTGAILLWIGWYRVAPSTGVRKRRQVSKPKLSKRLLPVAAPALASVMLAVFATSAAGYSYVQSAQSEKVMELKEHVAQVAQAPLPPPSPAPTNEPDQSDPAPIFETCKSAGDYRDAAWFSDLQSKVQDAVQRPLKELCVASNVDQVIFIAEQAETASSHGGKVGKYRISKAQLRLVDRNDKGQQRANRGEYRFGKQRGRSIAVLSHNTENNQTYYAHFEYDVPSDQMTLSEVVDTKTYVSKHRFSFEYPATYHVEDNGLEAAESFEALNPDGVATIEITSYIPGQPLRCGENTGENIPTCEVKVAFAVSRTNFQHYIYPANSDFIIDAQQIVDTFRR